MVSSFFRERACGDSLTRRAFLRAGAGAGLAAGLNLICGCSTPRKAGPPNVVLIVLDTTRRDHLSCYGYHRDTSPNLDRLAAKSVKYSNAISPSCWTLPAHASMFTGKFASTHGARLDTKGELVFAEAVADANEQLKEYRARPMNPEETTMADILAEAGYATGGVIAGPWMKKIFGMDKGFSYYDEKGVTRALGRAAPDVTKHALKWVNEVKQKPFFLFLNYFDPHYPYIWPEDFAMDFLLQYYTEAELAEKSKRDSPEMRSALYDMEIAYMDRSIGRLLDELKDIGVFDNTLFIVTADHGELLGEHDAVGHGCFLYEEELQIPLFIKYPDGEAAPALSDGPVQLTDLLPLVLNRLDLPVPSEVQGAEPPDIGHPVIAELYPLPWLSWWGDSQAIYDVPFKFIQSQGAGLKLFNLDINPGETKNFLEQESERGKAMQKELTSFLASLPKPPPPSSEKVLDRQTQEALQNLGYL